MVRLTTITGQKAKRGLVTALGSGLLRRQGGRAQRLRRALAEQCGIGGGEATKFKEAVVRRNAGYGGLAGARADSACRTASIR